MPIISHTLHSSTSNGSRIDVTYKFTDHLGKDYLYAKLVPIGFDTNSDMLSMYTNLDEGLSEGEVSEVLSDAEDGIDILSKVQAPKHATTRRLSRRLIRFMMREKDPYLVIALEPFLKYLQANYTNAQLKSRLNINTAQLQKMNNRVNAILNNKADFIIYDDNAEDIE